jgi:ribose 5-phosphate isomerase B
VNVLVLGARIIGSELAKDLCTIFLGARFTGEERHRRRLAKTLSIEQRYAPEAATRRKEP